MTFLWIAAEPLPEDPGRDGRVDELLNGQSAEGYALSGESDGPGFGSQADAETWIGENWRRLAGWGLAEVVLMRDSERVYALPLEGTVPESTVPADAAPEGTIPEDTARSGPTSIRAD